MALFVIPVGLKAAASFIGANGARAAAKKYGPKMVKEAQEAISKRQASIKAQEKMTGPSKGSIARSAETNKVAARNRRLAKERGEIPEEILSNIEQPLKFNKGGRVGLNKGGQPSYSNGEMPKAKAN